MLSIIRSDVNAIPLDDQSVDLVFGSPPYCDARTYGIDADRDCKEWVSWMLDATTESVRVSRGPVVWVAAGVTRNRNYWPACEGLMWEWFNRGGSMYRPCFWRRIGIPGSGGDQWFRSDVEYVMCFKRPGPLPWSDNVAMGHALTVCGTGLTHRGKSGARAAPKEFKRPEKANPGNLIDTGAGGNGALGDRIAHENEAPFPEDLAKWFVLSLCPPAGVVLDPFSGSGTTAKVAREHGRAAIACDVRMSQCELTKTRNAQLLLCEV